MKAISSLISMLLLIIITVTLAGMAFVFYTGVQEPFTQAEGSQENFRIVSAGNDKIYVKNTGQEKITDLVFYADKQLLTVTPANDCAGGIEPEKICEYTVSLADGSYELSIEGGSTSKKATLNVGIIFETATTSTVTTSITTSTTMPAVSGCADGTTEQDFDIVNGKKVHGCNGPVTYANAGTKCASGWHVGDVALDSGLNTLLATTPGTNLDASYPARWVYMNGDPGGLTGSDHTDTSAVDTVSGVDCWGSPLASGCVQTGSIHHRPVHTGYTSQAGNKVYLNGNLVTSGYVVNGGEMFGAICVQGEAPTLTPLQPVACKSTGPIQFVGWSANAVPNFAGSFSINKPAGTVQGDVMMAHIYSGVIGTMGAVPSGWSLMQAINTPSGGFEDSSFVFYKVAGSSEPASYVWDVPDGNQGVSGAIATYRNVNNFNPIHVSIGTKISGSGTTYSAPSITTTIDNTMFLILFGISYTSGAASWTPPVGMTERYDYDPLGDFVVIGLDLVDQPLTTAGPTGNKVTTVTVEPGRIGVAYSIALTSCVPSASGCADGTTDQDFGAANNKRVHGCNADVTYANAGTLCASGWHVGDIILDTGLRAVLETTPANTHEHRWIRMNGDPGAATAEEDYPDSMTPGPGIAPDVICWGTAKPCTHSVAALDFRPSHGNLAMSLYQNELKVLSNNGFANQGPNPINGAICVEGPAPIPSGCADGTTDQDFGAANGKKVHGCNGKVAYSDLGTLCSAGWHVGDVGPIGDSGLGNLLSNNPSDSLGHRRTIYINGPEPKTPIGYSNSLNGVRTNGNGVIFEYCWGILSPCLIGATTYPDPNMGNTIISGAPMLTHTEAWNLTVATYFNGQLIMSNQAAPAVQYHTSNGGITQMTNVDGAICVEG